MKPKIVILSAFLTPYRSGAEACAEELALRLCQDFDITIVTARGYSQEGPLQGKVPVVRVGTGLKIDKWLYPFLAPLIVRRLQPLLIHAVLETFAGLALHLCTFTAPRAKRLLTLQTLNRSFLKGIIVRSPHAVTAISSALQRVAQDVRRTNVVVIPNGIDVSAIPVLPKVPGRILFVGRLEPMKGVDVLLTAFAEISNSQFPISKPHLRVVGSGSEREKLEKLASVLGIAEMVTFVGYVPHPEVYEEYAQAEIFCGLSRSEALGNVFLESQAAGCAVVGTNVGGIPEIVVEGWTGLLVDPNSPAAAAAALATLLSDTVLRSNLSQAAREHARRYDWREIAERYKEVYDTLLSGSGAGEEKPLSYEG